METIVKKKPSANDLDSIFRKITGNKKGVDVKKYAGKVKAKDNPLTLQKKLRNEWK